MAYNTEDVGVGTVVCSRYHNELYHIVSIDDDMIIIVLLNEISSFRRFYYSMESFCYEFVIWKKDITYEVEDQ